MLRIFPCCCWPYLSSLEKCVFKSSAHFFCFSCVEVIYLLLFLPTFYQVQVFWYWVTWILYILISSDISFANILFYSVGYLFILLMVSLTMQRIGSHLFLLLFSLSEETVKKILLRPMSKIAQPTFSSRSFILWF